VSGPEKQYENAAVSVKEKRFKEAAEACNKIMADSPGSPLAADALFEIALINAHLDNPQRDYAQAARSFAEFIKRYPDNRRADEARTWISVLRTVQELKKQNEHLNESIEELKQLDIRHEEKRKGK
jgi:TolA-binding protein